MSEPLKMRFDVRPVPPPAEPPPLRTETSARQWRCSNCGQMQRGGTEMTWIPDGVRMGDPSWSVLETIRLNAYNGHHSGWCLTCVGKLTKSKPKPTTPVHAGPGRRFPAMVALGIIIGMLVGLAMLFLLLWVLQ